MPFSPGSFSDGFQQNHIFGGSGNFSGGSYSGAVGGFSVDPVEVATSVDVLVGGGFNPSQGLYPRAPSKKDISRARERFGLRDEISRAITAIAARQAKTLERDEQKRFEELSRELQLRGIEWDANHLQAMNVLRERLISAEIGLRLKAKLRADDEWIVLMLLAASI